MSDVAPALRIADADRERVAERLRRAAGEGRLGTDELEERLEAVFAARTHGDLEPLVADLPAKAPAGAPPRRRGHGDLRAFIATSILLVAIWALSGAGYFWPVWPILGWGLFAVGPVLPAPLRGTLPSCRRNASSRLSTTR
ncbi:MAG: DUF1707 domain-containing protein [Thermoleophilaceae bacterium]